MTYHRITTILLSITIALAVWAESHYATYLNNFAPFTSENNNNVKIDDNKLIISNNFSNDIIIADTVATGIKKFKFYVRAANLNNDGIKSHKYIDTGDNSTKKLDNTAWGIVWGYIDRQNFYAAITSCHDPYPHDDIFSNRSMTINILKVQDSSISVLKSIDINDGIDLLTGYNVLNVEYDGSKTSIAIGNKELRYIAEFEDICYSPNSQYGLLVGPAAKLAVERIVFKHSPITAKLLETGWTMQSLNEYFKKSNDALEGFWTFFDKSLNKELLKTGGRYTLALVKNGNGYDIIYVDGAQVNQPEWSCGMLKGRITPTQFIDNYSLLWYDAMMRPFDKDVYAIIENYTLLSLYFPAQKSMIRFAKSINHKKDNLH